MAYFNLVMILTGAVICLLNSVAGQPNWVRGKDTMKLYHYNSNERTMAQAKAYCEGLDGFKTTMAQIKNEQEQLAVRGLIKEHTWLGVMLPSTTDPRRGKILLWQDGTEIKSFTRWYGNPDNRNEAVLMLADSNTNNWYIDSSTGNRRATICEQSVIPPLQWKLGPDTTKEYGLDTSVTRNYKEATDYCNGQADSLASLPQIKTEAEQKVVDGLTEDSFYLGAKKPSQGDSRRNGELGLVWVDESNIDFNASFVDWEGEPDYSLYLGIIDGQWTTLNATTSLNVTICERAAALSLQEIMSLTRNNGVHIDQLVKASSLIVDDFRKQAVQLDHELRQQGAENEKRRANLMKQIRSQTVQNELNDLELNKRLDKILNKLSL